MRTDPLATHDPRVVGPWQLVGRVGSGGMGVVYLGRRTNRGRLQEAAVKVIPEYLLGRDTALARFRREIAVLISLDDPGIARVVAADLDEEPPWYAADVIDGPTLAHWVQTEGPLQPELWQNVALSLASTLTRLHARGIVHRDLKPHNVILGPSGPVIIDFGISAVVGSTSLTVTGESPRTDLWASPEQLRNEEATTATDIFAVGTLLAWAATGVHPFAPRGEYHREGLMAAILTADPVLDGLDPDAVAWLAPMLAKPPGDRPTALEVVDSITEVAPDQAIAWARFAQVRGWTAAARAWWQVAADAGQADASFELGNLAAAEGNEAGARSWWRLAAEAGHAEAARRVQEPFVPVPTILSTPRASDPFPTDSLSGPPAVPLPVTADGTLRVAGDTASPPATTGAGDPASRRGRRWPVVVLLVIGVAAVVAAAALWPREPSISTGPVRVSLSGTGKATRVDRIAMGDTNGCLLTQEHRALCWGSNTSGQLGSPGPESDIPREVTPTDEMRDGVERVAVGGAHVCALSQGHAYCWGSNSQGQLGVDKATTPSSTIPVRTHPRGVLAGKRLRFIGAAGDTSCAQDFEGHLYCWGDNRTGQLGDGSRDSRDSPVEVDSSRAWKDRPLRRFAVGGDHTCAVDEQNVIYCWGANDRGQLGFGNRAAVLTPRRVTTPKELSSVYDAVNLGVAMTCALTRPGGVLCWGANDHGQLGAGPGPDTAVPQEVTLPTAVRFMRVAASGPTACSTSLEGGVWCWGDNSSGQLGNGTTTAAPLPVKVADPVEGTLPALPLIAVGPTTTCGAALDGRAWCWGSDAHGLLGDGAG